VTSPKHNLQTPFVLVTGGKGGVGKTTLAVNLAVELQRSGLRTLIVDLDLGLANVGLHLDLPPGQNIEDALSGRCSLQSCVVQSADGVHVLPASSGSEHMGRLDVTQSEALMEGLAELSASFDIMIGDSAAGIGPDVLVFARSADRVLVVTTPEVPALSDAYGLIKALDQHGLRIDAEIPTPEVVVNLANGLEEGRAIARKLRLVCERFLSRSPRQAGWLPRSRQISESAGQGHPFVVASPEGLGSLCVGQIAERVGRTCSAKVAASCT
jgi:flagellar biosynthesis protein FlhG